MGRFYLIVAAALLLLLPMSFGHAGASASDTAPLAVVRCSKRARHLVQEQKSAEAIELLTQVLRRFPDSAELLVTRGQVLTYVEKDGAACADFERALLSSNLNPQQCSVMISTLLEIENCDLALKVYAKGKSLTGTSAQRSSFLFQVGRLLRRVNRRPEAVVALIESNRLHPDNLDHWEELAALYRDLHKYDLVISTVNSFEKANTVFEQRAGLARIYDYRASAYMYKKQYRQAISDLTRAIKISPLSVSFVRKRADCYGKLGDSLGQKKDEKKADEIVKSFIEK